ncbi:MAG: hypothetical protein OXG77_02640 [Chloroflexi bacterium]|nr:hypothetical protein [Chloroflexota bacterium]MYC48619.1 hypothetical protein [Chloroflexota bacterium]
MHLAHATNRLRAPLAAVSVLALALAAVWLFANSENARGQTDLGACELSPWLLDALLDDANYDLPSYRCDELELDGLAIWDFSTLPSALERRLPGRFSISDSDYKLLLELSDFNEDSVPQDLIGFGERGEVRLIDLTGTGYRISDVDFRNIPIGTGIALTVSGSARTGFQTDVYSTKENRMGYVSVAFPGVLESDQDSLVVSATVDADSDERNLIEIGQNMLLNGDARNVVYYWPVYVESDNDNDPDWDFELEIDADADAYRERDGTGRRESVDLTDVLDISVAEIVVSDADAPRVLVSDRSSLVEDAIEDALDDITSITHRGDDITLKDLSAITSLDLEDTDDGRTFALSSGDLEGLSGLTKLHLKGASRLPRGIFDGVGDRDRGVVIDFSRNSPHESGDPRGGNYDLGSIPGYILSDIESHQTLILTGQKDSSGNSLVTGLDQSSYRARPGESFAVTVPVFYSGDAEESESYYVVAQLPYDFAENTEPIVDKDDLGGIIALHDDDVARTMIMVPEEVDEDKGQWVLFVFEGSDEDLAALVDWALINP